MVSSRRQALKILLVGAAVAPLTGCFLRPPSGEYVVSKIEKDKRPCGTVQERREGTGCSTFKATFTPVNSEGEEHKKLLKRYEYKKYKEGQTYTYDQKTNEYTLKQESTK